MCTMLNQRGGDVLIGVASNGRVVGQQSECANVEQVNAVRLGPDPSPPYEYRGTAYPRTEYNRVLCDGNRQQTLPTVSPSHPLGC